MGCGTQLAQSLVCARPGCSLPPGWRAGRAGGRKAHLLAEVVQLEQRLQVRALPLSSHVEVGQLGLEGPLRGGKGGQLRDLRSARRAGPAR